MKNIFVMTALMAACMMQGCTGGNKREEKGLEKLSWLIGKWTFMTGDSILFSESWQQINDSVFSGAGSGIKGNDTLFFEQLSVRKEGKDICYIPVVRGQNDGKELIFVLTKHTEAEFVFENPAHDFPQTIKYYHKGVAPADTLYAAISGKENGQERTEEFLFFRSE